MLGPRLAVIILPFLQIGQSYWLAGHILCAAAMLSLSGSQNLRRVLSVNVASRGAIVLCLMASTMVFPRADGQDLLRTLREGICFFLIAGLPGFRLKKLDEGIFSLLLIYAIGEFILVVTQLFFLSRGLYFGIPQDLFVINAATLPGALDLRYSDIRPMGTYGEPSYLAGASIAIIYGLRQAFRLNRKAMLTVILLSFTVILSRSMSGLFALLILWGMILRQSRFWKVYGVGLAVGLPVVMVVLLMVGDVPMARLGRVASGEDGSFLVRVVTPILVVPSMLVEYPLGIPFAKFIGLGTVLDGTVATSGSVANGFFNILINYGVFGILLLVQLFISYRSLANMFLLVTLMFQNGGFLAFDKIALIAIAMLLANTIKGHVRNGGQSGDKGHSSMRQRDVG